MNNSELESLAQVLLDSIGPRLTASPGIEAAQDWAITMLRELGGRSADRAVRHLGGVGSGPESHRPDGATGPFARGQDSRVEPGHGRAPSRGGRGLSS